MWSFFAKDGSKIDDDSKPEPIIIFDINAPSRAILGSAKGSLEAISRGEV